MNTIQLQVDIEDNCYTDVTITFTDSTSEVTMKLHRNILAWQCPYFNTIFTFGDNFQQDKFTIRVDDVSIAVILIRSFYGDVKELSPAGLLRMTKCKSYFCIDIVQSDLYNLEIPPEYIDLLLEIINLPEIKLDGMLIRMVKRNLPKDYDMRRLGDEIREMILAKDLMMISTSNDKTLKLWNIESGKCIMTYTGHQDSVNLVTLSSDNRQMVSASSDKTLKLWDVETGSCLRTYTGHRESVNSVVLSSDNLQMVSGSGDKTLKLWDIETGECLRTYTDHKYGVYSVVLTSDNRHIVSAGGDNNVILWDIETGKSIRTYCGHSCTVYSVKLTSDNS
jgi:hypothetical protein